MKIVILHYMSLLVDYTIAKDYVFHNRLTQKDVIHLM